jgi:hypothetical protein
MPELVWLFRTALLCDRTSASCVALAEVLETVSHDRLARLLPSDWSGPRRLELALRTRFVWERGDVIIDETVPPPPCAAAIAGLAWVFSSLERKPVFCLVLLVWTNGTLRIPRACVCGGKMAPRHTSVRESDSALPAIIRAAALTTSCVMPGSSPKPSGSGCATMDGLAYAVSTRIAGAMATRGVTTGGTLTGLSAAG